MAILDPVRVRLQEKLRPPLSTPNVEARVNCRSWAPIFWAPTIWGAMCSLFSLARATFNEKPSSSSLLPNSGCIGPTLENDKSWVSRLGPSARTMTHSMAFSNARTLPGHSWLISIAMASEVMPVIRPPRRLLKNRQSKGISSVRSHKGGNLLDCNRQRRLNRLIDISGVSCRLPRTLSGIIMHQSTSMHQPASHQPSAVDRRRSRKHVKNYVLYTCDEQDFNFKNSFPPTNEPAPSRVGGKKAWA